MGLGDLDRFAEILCFNEIKTDHRRFLASVDGAVIEATALATQDAGIEIMLFDLL
jgi:hypothetical protein